MVINRGVGGHFDAALRASPVFGGAEKCRPYSLATMVMVNKPTLDIANGQPFVTAVSNGAEVGFEKANKSAVILLRHKNEESIDAPRRAVQHSAKFRFVM